MPRDLVATTQGIVRDRLLYRNKRYGITATLDPMSQLLGQVVVYPHDGAHVSRFDMRPSRIAQAELVVQAIGRRMLRVTGSDARITTHGDGLSVTDHVHTLIVPVFEDPVSRLHGAQGTHRDTQTARQVAKIHELLSLEPAEVYELNTRLTALEGVADTLDADFDPTVTVRRLPGSAQARMFLPPIY